MVIVGAVAAGVEHGVLILRAADGTTWQLLGSPVRSMKGGSRVRLTGRPDDRAMAGTAQQGRRFLVEKVERVE